MTMSMNLTLIGNDLLRNHIILRSHYQLYKYSGRRV